MFIGAHDEKNPLNICTTSIYTLMLSMFLTILFTFFFLLWGEDFFAFLFLFFYRGLHLQDDRTFCDTHLKG